MLMAKIDALLQDAAEQRRDVAEQKRDAAEQRQLLKKQAEALQDLQQRVSSPVQAGELGRWDDAFSSRAAPQTNPKLPKLQDKHPDASSFELCAASQAMLTQKGSHSRKSSAATTSFNINDPTSTTTTSTTTSSTTTTTTTRAYLDACDVGSSAGIPIFQPSTDGSHSVVCCRYDALYCAGCAELTEAGDACETCAGGYTQKDDGTCEACMDMIDWESTTFFSCSALSPDGCTDEKFDQFSSREACCQCGGGLRSATPFNYYVGATVVGAKGRVFICFHMFSCLSIFRPFRMPGVPASAKVPQVSWDTRSPEQHRTTFSTRHRGIAT